MNFIGLNESHFLMNIKFNLSFGNDRICDIACATLVVVVIINSKAGLAFASRIVFSIFNSLSSPLKFEFIKQ